MIIERNEFRLKFGKAREAISLWCSIIEASKEWGDKSPRMRLLTDISGPAYTLVVEMFLKDLTEINPKNYFWVTHQKFQDLYQQFVPLCEYSERTYFRIEAEYNF
jgi:hypothetical protein